MSNNTPLDRWTGIAAATALILSKLRSKQQIQRAEEDERRTEHEKQEYERSKLTVV